MKTRFTRLTFLLILSCSGLSDVLAQSSPRVLLRRPMIRPSWKIPEVISRRLTVEPRRMYAGLDVGYYRAWSAGSAAGRLLSTFRLNHELFPGLTVGWHLTRRLSLETGLYNLPSTIAYTVELGPKTSEPGGIGIQYAVLPLRLRYRIWQPTPWLGVHVHGGMALAYNNSIRKGSFERLSAVYPPVWGDTVQVTNEGVMIHNLSPLLEGGAEVALGLGTNVALVLYGRGVVGLQPLWRNDITYQINQQDPRQTSLTARVGGYTLGFGLRYTFRVGKKYRVLVE